MELLAEISTDTAVGREIGELLELRDPESGEATHLELAPGPPESKNKIRPQQFRLEVKSRDPESERLLCDLTMIPSERGDDPHYWLIFRPVDSAERETALESVVESFLEVTDAAVMLFGPDKRVLSANSAALELLDVPRGRLIGRKLEDIERKLGDPQPPVNGDSEAIAQILSFATPEGRQRFLRKVVRAIAIPQTGRSFYVLMLDDITDELRTEEELRKMHRMQSIRNLVGGIAHDFNDLITAILGNISLAKLESAGPGEVRDLLLDAEQALRQAEVLTHELSAVSESAGQQPRTSFAELVQSAAAFVLRGTNVKLRATFAADLPEPSVDANRLAQVVQNLVMNAQQAMPEGGIVEISADRDEIATLPKGHLPTVRLMVRDHGEGIPKVHLKRIFEPFYTTREAGSGLGLTVAQSIVAGSGGKIDVESRPGYGSAFTVLLPTARAVPRKSFAEGGVSPCANKKILVMDDDRFIRDILGRMIDRLGCRSSLAADGNEAIFLYQEAMDSGHPFDAVIMDLTVPGGMGGKDAVRRILRVDPEATVVVTSGLPNDPILTEYQRFGFRGSVAKPFTFDQIAETLASVLSH